MEEADRKWMGFTIKFSGSLTVYVLHGFPVDRGWCDWVLVLVCVLLEGR